MRKGCLFLWHRFILPLVFLLSASTFFPSVGLSEKSRGADKPAGLEPGWSPFLRGGSVHQFNGELDGGGSFDTDRLFLQGGVSHTTKHGRSISPALGYGFDGYDFSGDSGFAGLRPWDSIHSFRFSVPVRVKCDDHWTVFVIPTVRATAESGADFDEAFSGGGFAGASFRFSGRLTIGPGIGAITRIEDDPIVFPLLIVHWKITDRLSLETGRGLGATLGPELTINWKATDSLTLSLGGRYERLRFRLDNDGVACNGIGDDRSIPILGAVSYQFSPKIRASLLGGVELGGEVRLEDERGHRLSESEYDSAGFLGFFFNLLF
ncbi:MAG: TonB-dependent receptor [Thermodesulfobacteriota bacterium]|nr:TonB-dependent receptor [Thermodesulfobacteriota bacterium]